MKRIALLFGAVSSCLWAQSGLNRPALGQMIDRQQFLRPVYGIGGAFNIGSPLAEEVLSSACSSTLCLAKTESALISGGIVTPAPPGYALIAIASIGATVYFPATRQFVRWQNGALSMFNLSVFGTVLSLASNSSGLTIAVERSDTVWITSSDGTILDSLPLGVQAVLLTANGTVYATANALILRKSDGSELSFPAQAIENLFSLGDGYVEARAGGVLYALRTIPGREQLFQLPQPLQERHR